TPSPKRRGGAELSLSPPPRSGEGAGGRGRSATSADEERTMRAVPPRLATALCLLFGPCVTGRLRGADAPARTDLFVSGKEGYPTFRIPSLLVTPKGTLLAFCEGRKTGRDDHGDIDLVMKRSPDGGKTWGPLTLVHEEGGTAKITIGNPCPVVDRPSGVVWLTFTRNNDDVFVTTSRDDGKSWSKPEKITAQVKKPGWTWYATGPGV